MSTVAAEPQFHTSGIVRLTRPQLVGTMTGLVLAMFLAALDQTIVGTAEPRIIASLSGFNRYPWVATAYMLTSTMIVPIIAKLSDLWGRKWFFLWGSAVFVATSALCGASGNLNFTGPRRHEPVDPVPRPARHRRGRHHGPDLHHRRRYFFARRTRPLSGLFLRRVGTRRHLRPHARRLAHRSHFLARHLLRQSCRWASSPSPRSISSFPTSVRRPCGAFSIGPACSPCWPASGRCCWPSPG